MFVENGEPEVVMMSFQEYEKLARSDSNLRIHSNDSNFRSATPSNYSSGEFQPKGGEVRSEWSDESFESPAAFGETEFMAPVAAGSSGLPIRIEDIRLEDLPI